MPDTPLFPTSPDAELSAVDQAKLASNHLRGTVAEELAKKSDQFTKEVSLVLKHHGMLSAG